MPISSNFVGNISRDHIIFDLDGTLIESAPSVLKTIEVVMNLHSYAIKVPLDRTLIGPPLIHIIRKVTGESDPIALKVLVETFKNIYDNNVLSFLQCMNGANMVLKNLQSRNKRLFIATNKRQVPTHKIINFLCWQDYFDSIYTIDSKCPEFLDKTEMLKCMIAELNLDINRCVYVGDTFEDCKSAQENNLLFLFAEWGYGREQDIPEGVIKLNSVSQLLNMQ